ncbi:PLP-dependent aminotransferase family protein [uncultured Mailhella sp.]|uniref:aminotransferase-like domain-containing protein n=1 Tax=uncultured Mailhella sp. TaxID=1981031 RepID=UPI0025F6340E|nr:PLP-dependent aminotransferase family protein [uncultured Mailhella sp.]
MKANDDERLRRLRELYEESGAPCRYQRVAEALEVSIRQGVFRPGDALPTQRALAARLNVTTGTATHGYAEAAKRGLVTGVTGRGSFVSAAGSDVDVMPPPAPLPPATAWPDGRDRAPVSFNEESSDGHCRNLGFIAPFENLNPSLHDALCRMMTRMDARAMAELQSYHRPAGMERHREAGALWARRYGVPVSGRDLLVCAGSQHALMTLLTTLCTPGDRLAVETLSYPLLRQLSWRLRLPLVPIRTDACGMLPDALENACRSGGVKAVYLMPSCRNPTLTRMPESRRKELVEVCRRHDVLIIEDDVYALAINAQPAPPFAELAPERTCFVAATSEILGGGLRVAYLCPPQHTLEELERTISYTISMVPPLMAELAAQWITDGTAERTLMAKREEAAARNALARNILDGFPLMSRNSGFFCWLHLPEAWTGRKIASEARKRGVIVAEGEHFQMGHSTAEHGVRLALGGVSSREELARALGIIREILES